MLRGAGVPFFSKFLDLEIDQDSTIVKLCFLQKTGKPDRIGDATFLIVSAKSLGFQTYFFELVGRR